MIKRKNHFLYVIYFGKKKKEINIEYLNVYVR